MPVGSIITFIRLRIHLKKCYPWVMIISVKAPTTTTEDMSCFSSNLGSFQSEAHFSIREPLTLNAEAWYNLNPNQGHTLKCIYQTL